MVVASWASILHRYTHIHYIGKDVCNDCTAATGSDVESVNETDGV